MNHLAQLSFISSNLMVLTGFFHGVFQTGPGGTADVKTNVVRYHMLKCLSQSGKRNLTEISALLAAKKNTVSELVDRMVRDGLVVREAGARDRRKTFLAITAKGRAAAKEFEASLMGSIRDLMKDMSTAERRELGQAIETIIRLLLKRRGRANSCPPA
jgi:DNA-binding MarR family transcriptional regulator